MPPMLRLVEVPLAATRVSLELVVPKISVSIVAGVRRLHKGIQVQRVGLAGEESRPSARSRTAPYSYWPPPWCGRSPCRSRAFT